MADNVAVTAGAGTTIATDDIGGVQFQRVKIALGPDGTHRRDWNGESTPYRKISTADNNSTVVKNAAGHLSYIIASNLNASVRYLKFYNMATAPAPATDNANLVLVVALPPNSAMFVAQFANPIYFSTGIAFAIVTGIADTNNTSTAASEQLVNLGYT